LVTSILVAIDTFPFIQSAYSFRAHSYLRQHCLFALILYKVRRILDNDVDLLYSRLCDKQKLPASHLTNTFCLVQANEAIRIGGFLPVNLIFVGGGHISAQK